MAKLSCNAISMHIGMQRMQAIQYLISLFVHFHISPNWVETENRHNENGVVVWCFARTAVGEDGSEMTQDNAKLGKVKNIYCTLFLNYSSTAPGFILLSLSDLMAGQAAAFLDVGVENVEAHCHYHWLGKCAEEREGGEGGEM